jgi:glyoxylase-like metal-dependent hydrolase (beta-lactamase superfamily II)/8-oxo-dGTP pyrophosphatase MutT (NUDIX family)
MTGSLVEPALAATVVLVRRGRSGVELLLTRRPHSMAFAPNMHVFPGGRVDLGDAEPSLLARSIVSPAEAARALGGDLAPALALAAHVAAIRELFEEAGVLLADTGERDGVGGGAAGAADAAGVAVPTRSASLARSALVGGDATFGAIAAELDLRLRTDLLVPLSRWVTPPTMPRRFDARFFAAELPARARLSFEGDEVAGHAWLTPAAALREMADAEFGMWVPTSATLQQLEYTDSVAEIRERLTPGLLGAIEVDAITPDATRIVMPAGGGVAGQPVCAYLVGRRRHVLIDPGDPTGPSLDRAMELAFARGGSIEAIALTQVDPDHAGGAEALALVLGIPILVGPGGGRPLPYAVRELADLEPIDACDVPLQAIHTPGPSPHHLCFLAGEAGAAVVVSGDLEGLRGARAILAPMNPQAVASSRDRLRGIAPIARWWPGHPVPSGEPAAPPQLG